MVMRPATDSDLPSVKAIYDEHVHHGIATFDVEPPPLAYWRSRLESTEVGDHFVVADEDGVAVGYAYSSSYRPRPAYRHTRETSLYLDKSALGRGLGRALYDELLSLLRTDGVHLVVAGIALPNDASVALHRSCGFEEVGVMREVGRKFDRWIDVLWLQKLLALPR